MSFRKIDSAITKLFGKIAVLSGIFMIIIAFLATANVITSKMLKWSIPSVNDWVTYLFLGAVYCSIAYVRLGSGLISVDILSSHYPAVVKNLLSIAADVLGFGIFFMIFYNSIPLLKKNYAFHVMSSTGSGAFPLWPFNLIVVIFTLIMAFCCIWCIIRVFVNGITKKQNDPAAPESEVFLKEGDIL